MNNRNAYGHLFFFQAEDGIRDVAVTGVQTCALPISSVLRSIPPAEWTVERMRKVKYGLAGTVDQIKAEVAALRTIGGGGDLEWFGWFFDQGFMPWGEEIRQIELFAKHIIPPFRGESRKRLPPAP